MFARALLAFLALPGLFAFALPLALARVDPWARGRFDLAPAPLALGSLVLLWCVRDFYVAGKGTLAPWDPPKRLVVVGLYRFSRNPMYVGVLTLVVGWAAWFGSALVGLYAIVLALGFHLRVVAAEEPWLARTFGEDWQRYARRVPRWVGRRGGPDATHGPHSASGENDPKS